MKIIVSASILALTFTTFACHDHAADSHAAEVKDAPAPAETAQAAAPAASGAIALSPANSSIGFVGAKITGSHPGKFNAFSGSIVLDAAAPENSKINVNIDMASVQSDSPKLDGHLKSPDFFDTAKFPKSNFVGTKIAKGGAGGASHTITGTLTLHGVTKEITFPATVNLDGGKVAVKSEFNINRKDFGIVYPGMPDDLIKDEVVIKLDLNAKAPTKS